MPRKRRLPKGKTHRITDEAIAAWKACDHLALNRALRLTGRSPLPLEVTALGGGEDEELDDDRCWDQDHAEVLELQRELFAIAGPPDKEAVRAAYQKHADDAEMMVDYYRACIADPSRGSVGVAAERKRMMAEELMDLRFYQGLLAELDE
jgi:hypothetical protein